ncbi:deoxyribose-phosphate aldolase [Rhizobacter sp. AJA081-3]|uniref:deoxyribose-phosphate aldolase n=1 Tax=Rhizobacter sp. AJA081-3 TaxID=2753607 RepID=UPI001BB4A0F9|nr:deoxyribose-phosphate aldolase [Rhizobacter sp. AJA081-3]QTN22799.1 deoxyribose-phosphate aldolase [Rhizobacter sp. AJA081-3]
MARTVDETARIALACLDLTSLNDSDSEADIVRLAERAAAAPGRVAALCVWPRFVRVARSHAPTGVAVAAVANFPEGGNDIERALRDTGEIVQAGAQELDLVLPWRALTTGDDKGCAALLRAVRRASEGLRLKVILESGELATPALVVQASRIALAEGADFLKTSTGKTPRGATPEAARVMLQAIAADVRVAGRAGFKASGGVRSVADASVYIDLVERALGADALVPARFRIGASGLLADIEAVLAGRSNAPAAAGY